MFNSHSKLAVAIIAYYVAALPFTIFVCTRHGFGRHAGWFYLLSMGIVRIVGAALTIAAYAHPSTGLFVASDVLSSIGLVPLILALMGILKRVNDGIQYGRFPHRVFQVVHIAAFVGLILAIVAGVDASSPDNQNDVNNSHTMRKASSILLLAAGAANALMAIRLATVINKTQPGDRILVWCALGSIPFLLTREIYVILVSFDYNNPDFNPLLPNIYIQAFMQILMEFICYALYLVAGLIAEKMEKGKYVGEGTELLRGNFQQEPQNYGQPGGYRGQASGVAARSEV